MDKYEFRRERLLALVNALGYGGRAAVAKAISKSPDYISRMLYPASKPGSKRIGEDTADLITAAYPAWLDLRSSAPDAGNSAALQANEPQGIYKVDAWPFLTITQDEWNRIPFATRQVLEQQIKSLVPAAANQQAA